MASKSGSCCADHQPSAPPGVSTEVQAPEPVQIEYDFVEEPPREYFCPVTFELLSEPQKTDCCGRQLAREVVSRLQREGKPCPLCNDPNISVTNDKHFKRKVNGLKVRCPHKRNGCEWVGELGDMGKHFTQCPLQLVECEFAQAGCHERVPRRDLARHMEEGGQRHLLSMSLLNLSLTRELHQKMAEKDRQIAELQEQLQEQSSKLEKQIKDLQGQCKRIEKQLQTVLESEFESDFQGEIQGEYCGTYTFESVQFPGVYLRMDGNGVTESVGPGGGTVNCQFGAGPWEEFELIYHADSCNYSIESVQFPGVYLRMDGNRVTRFVGPGGGVVNCQFGAGPWEKFNIDSSIKSAKFPGASLPSGTYTIESVQFPGVYLRMDGNGVTESVAPGGGTVNCQFGAGPWEEFKLNHIDSCNNSIESAGPLEKFNVDNSIKSAQFPGGASLPSGTYTFESVQFPGVYLRMDGNGVTESVGPGGGTVNCQFGAGPWEEFELIYHTDSCNYSIESVQFPGVYLRMDGNRVTRFVGPGGGVVNCQFGAGPWEKFNIDSSMKSAQFPGASLPSGTYTFESVQFPRVYLRMDGNGVTESVGPGGGTVNCQFGAGPWEEFKLNHIDSCNNSIESAGPLEKFNVDNSIKSAQFPGGACLPSGTYTFESVQFPGVYLRMDGNGVTESVGPGGGTVNCQFGAGSWEEFELIYHTDSCNYSIESVQFPGVYLRMDGNRVTRFVGPGGGVVNCQFRAGPWEMFKVNHVGSCNYSIESAQFPGVYLRMDGNGVTESVGPGGGTVNCQFGAGPWEMFKLHHINGRNRPHQDCAIS